VTSGDNSVWLAGRNTASGVFLLLALAQNAASGYMVQLLVSGISNTS
jgi:hypothetical protein